MKKYGISLNRQSKSYDFRFSFLSVYRCLKFVECDILSLSTIFQVLSLHVYIYKYIYFYARVCVLHTTTHTSNGYSNATIAGGN